jgi:hypothetical protein
MDITEDYLTKSSELKFKETLVICITLRNIHVKINPPPWSVFAGTPTFGVCGQVGQNAVF